MSHKSSARVTLPSAKAVLEQLLAHARDHDVLLEQTGPETVKILVGNGSIGISANDTGLSFDICAESVSILYFLKEAAVQHLGEIAPETAEALRWRDQQQNGPARAAPPSFHELSLAGASEPLSGLIRLRLNGDGDLSGLAGPGIHVKLMLPATAGRAPVWPQTSPNGLTVWPKGEDTLHVRYYTIKSIDLKTGELDIDIVRHKGGLIADWAETALPGAKIGLLGPGGGEEPGPAHHVLLCGDQTALPALARMLENLPDNVSGDIIGEADGLASLQSYLPTAGLNLHALPKEQFASSLKSYAAQLTSKQKPDFAWFAGEHNTAQDMRRFFKSELGLSKGRQFAITYWRDGASLEAG